MPKSDTFLGIWLYTKCVTFSHDSVGADSHFIYYLSAEELGNDSDAKFSSDEEEL